MNHATDTPTPGAEGMAPETLSELLHGPRAPLVLDLRAPEDYLGERGHIEAACLFPLDRLSEAMTELSGLEGRVFVLVCEDGAKSEGAALALRNAGFRQVRVLHGGMAAWHAAGLSVHR